MSFEYQVIDLIKKTSNDAELGSKIRSLYLELEIKNNIEKTTLKFKGKKKNDRS